MFNYLIILGCGAITYVLEEKCSRVIFPNWYSALLSFFAYAVINLVTTYLILNPFGRITCIDAADGSAKISYGSTAVIFSMIVALFWGIVFGYIKKIYIQSKITHKIFWIFSISMFVMAVCGITVVNCRYNESWKLLWYDFRNGFSGMKSYAEALLTVFLIVLIATFIFYRILIRDVGTHRYCIYLHIYNIYTVLALFCAVCGLLSIREMTESEYGGGVWKPTKTIGHSFGVVNDDAYTGSWEAFEENYANGRRVMEVDIIMSADDRGVLKHEWDIPVQEGISEENIPDEANFLKAKLDGIYTPMSFEQLCGLMIENSDLWIVTDTKTGDIDELSRQFKVLTDTISETGAPEIMDRFIIQVYNEQMFEYLRENYAFKTYIFTMYDRFYTSNREEIFCEVCRYCVNKGIKTLTIPYDCYNEEMQQIADAYGRNLYVHTINDKIVADELIHAGVTGIYTDELYDDDL